MKEALLLCAIFAFASVKADCRLYKRERRTLVAEVNRMIVGHNKFLMIYKKDVEHRYRRETEDLKEVMDRMMNVDYFCEKLKMPKKVNIDHCLMKFRYQVTELYDGVVAENIACGIAYMNITALEPISKKAEELKEAVQKLGQVCNTSNLAELTEELRRLQDSSTRMFWQLVTSEKNLEYKINKAVELYKESFVVHVEKMKVTKASFEEAAKNCIKTAPRAKKEKRWSCCRGKLKCE